MCFCVISESIGDSQAEALKEENDSLLCQLDTYRNEVKLLKQEGKNHPISNEADNTCIQQVMQVIRYLIEQAAKMLQQI